MNTDDDQFGPYKECPFCVERGLEPLVVTPRWKIRRKLVKTEEGLRYLWCVYETGTANPKVRLRIWENALTYVELYESA